MGFFVTFLASWAHAYAKEGEQVLQCFFLLSLPYKRVWLSKKPVRHRFGSLCLKGLCHTSAVLSRAAREVVWVDHGSMYFQPAFKSG